MRKTELTIKNNEWSSTEANYCVCICLQDGQTANDGEDISELTRESWEVSCLLSDTFYICYHWNLEEKNNKKHSKFRAFYSVTLNIDLKFKGNYNIQQIQ